MAVVGAEKPVAVTPRPPSGWWARRASLQSKQTRLAWVMLIPTLAVVVFVAAYPLVQTFYLSFTDAAFGSTWHFTGWTNFYNLLHDQEFWLTVLETFKFAVITVFFEFVLGMGIALVVNSNFPGRGALRAAMLVPWAVITVVNAEAWSLMYNDTYGVFDDILQRIHFPGAPFSFLTSLQPNLALGAISLIDIWKTTPFVALLLLAGLQLIPGDVYEAARVDGANLWQQFWRITLPLLRPAILVTLIFRTMDALRVFDVFQVIFGLVPCDTHSCLMSMAVYEYEYIVQFSGSPDSWGYGAAISVGIFVILAIVIAIYVKAIPMEQST